MKFIHLADCHLASENKFSSDIGVLIRQKSWETFEKILKESDDVDFALIGGDLFERSYFTTKDYHRLFEIIKGFSKNVYYVTGNHDYIDYDNDMFFIDKPSNLKILPSNKFDYYQEGKVRIYGISYDDRIFNKELPYYLKLDSNYFNICLLHGLINEAKSNYLNLDSNKIKSMGFDYIGLGHIHKPLTVADGIYYSGTIEARDFSEKEDYGYIVYDKGEIIRKEISSLKFTELVLSTGDFSCQKDLIKYIKNILDYSKINFLRLKLKNDLSFEINKKDILSSLNIFHLEIDEEEIQDFSSLVDMYPDTLLTGFLKESRSYDKNDKILARARELGIDAILRSKNE